MRYFSTLPVDPAQVHEIGLRQVASLNTEMRAIAERSFRTSDVKGLLAGPED